jgi:branched-chain amino acid transport system ATP-binding protein
MLLKAENLALRYPTGALGIEDVSIEIAEGQIVALIGANGAGKTTTCRVLSGFLKSEDTKIVRGRVTFGGLDVTGWEPHRLVKAGISAVPERNKIFRNLTVREHFTSTAMHRSRAERAEALDFGLQLFPMVRDRLKQCAGTLSGGQQQMVAVARALMSSPRVLILDEPTAGLSPQVVEAMVERLHSLRRAGLTILLLEQNVDVVLQVSSHVSILHRGRITATADPTAIATRPEFVAGLFSERAPASEEAP